MDISEVARRAGVPASTLRYYEKKGLIASLGPQGTRRRFAPGVLNQLALIALGQAAGLSLDEIHAMLSPREGPKIDRPLLAAKADEIDITIRHLQAMSRGLRHAAACPARSHAECATFQRLLKAAASGALDGRRLRRERGLAVQGAGATGPERRRQRLPPGS
jgi:DNA-binding transcriptional MerR regulator